ncbi:hypothetical protein [Peribacillus muralis]|uniref:hypothetical protein n=1 Tax=Peribacillus muralis TaxID=264697 RepID=UPI003D07C292
MKVQIENEFYLESDDKQFIIKEYIGKQDKEGNERFKVYGYFGSIQQALKKFLSMKVMQSNAVTLSQLVEDVKRIEQYIDSKFSI